MGEGILHAEETVLAKVGKAYRGVGFTEVDCVHMSVDALAERFEVHENSIHNWVRRFGWQRPAWYRRRYRRTAIGGDMQAQRDRLLDLLRELVGKPTPSDGHFGKALGCSGMTVGKRLGDLRMQGHITVERSGCRRRFTLKDGLSTAWTARAGESHVTMERLGIARAESMPILRKQRRLEELLKIIRAAAENGRPCPDNTALGRALRAASNYAAMLVRELEVGGHFKVERRASSRRITFPDGKVCPFPFRTAAPRMVIPDLVARAATVALQRRGLQVFDCGVHDENWQERWSIDGKIVDRGGLLAAAAQ